MKYTLSRFNPKCIPSIIIEIGRSQQSTVLPYGENLLIWYVSLSYIIFGVLIFLDNTSKKKKFYHIKKEYELSLAFEQTQQLINIYFFEHGWYPDSLQQIDSIFKHKSLNANLENVNETRYRFFVDPFSGKFYHYLPTLNTRYRKPDGYYLLSAGIDGNIDNAEFDSIKLKLYNSLSFSYFDFYLGKKDVLVKKESIKDWVERQHGLKFSLSRLARNYDPEGKRKPPRFVEFNGVVGNVFSNHFTVEDSLSRITADCYLAPFDNIKQPTLGKVITVKGILNKIQFEPDTILTFSNCSMLERQ